MATPPTADRTAADHAFVTLITSDDYLPGALAQSAALNDLHPTRRGGPFPTSIELEIESDPVPFTTVCLVTPETVSVGSIKQLRRTFDLVIGVEVIEGDKDSEEIKLLGRPDLNQTFTKLHILRLAQFVSVVFLDADVLPLRPMSHLLNMVSSWPDDYFQDEGGDKTPTATAPGVSDSGPAPSFADLSKIKRNPRRLNNPAYPCPVSAAPDVGWPDIFNSGVIVLAPPGERGFKEAMDMRSWDGGDQGTLNEWAGRQAGLTTAPGAGGSGWNRLSFRYNVTPSGAYTYAPAYAKFGAAIHAVHFIGAGKPWTSLSFRPPFISSNGSSVDKYAIGAYGPQGVPGDAKASAYAYHALVDRWFLVYDAHFRVAQSSDADSKSEFEVRKYESAWEGGGQAFAGYDGGVDAGGQVGVAPSQVNQYPHVVPPHTYHIAAYSASTGFQPASPYAATLEELRRLALHGNGRADVARAGEGAYISMPLDGRISLMRPPRPEPAAVDQNHDNGPHHHDTHDQHRPSSPPTFAWNPALEPPPDGFPGGLSQVPYVQNQWDMPYRSSGQFFAPPQQTEFIPKELIQRGDYSALTMNGFQPDRGQVKSVFPWEEGNRNRPTRSFPDGGAPIATAPAPTRVFPSERPPSPPRELGAAYVNAWDDVPSIQRYASRLSGAKVPLTGAPVTSPPEPPKPEGEWSWERDGGQGDASSRDGDDEDDESESEKTTTGAADGQESSNTVSGSNGTSRPKMGSRSGSRSGGSRSGSITRTSDSTTVPVQTLRSSQATSMPGRNGNASLKGFGSYLAEKRKAQGALEGPMDVRARLATLGADVPAVMYPPGIEPQLPGLVRAPIPDTPTTAGEDGASSPSLAEPSFEFSHSFPTIFSTVTYPSVAGTPGSTMDVLSHTQNISYENGLTNDSSLPPSPGSSSPNELESRSPPPPPARTFDESRSVDAFKRDTHEVLARFLRIGTWESEESQGA